MSNLQIGLAIAGGVVLAAVVAHGAWSSRKNTPRQALPEPGSGMQADPMRP
jgi:FtsZ-interacting cell division protein ZipA